MPIYEYTCETCGNEFEILIRGNEKASCPSCGKTRLAKKFSLAAAHTAGSTQPSCPVQESGACDVSNCCGHGCGMNR